MGGDNVETNQVDGDDVDDIDADLTALIEFIVTAQNGKLTAEDIVALGNLPDGGNVLICLEISLADREGEEPGRVYKMFSTVQLVVPLSASYAKIASGNGEIITGITAFFPTPDMVREFFDETVH
jgi:hypothetical protein